MKKLNQNLTKLNHNQTKHNQSWNNFNQNWTNLNQYKPKIELSWIIIEPSWTKIEWSTTRLIADRSQHCQHQWWCTFFKPTHLFSRKGAKSLPILANLGYFVVNLHILLGQFFFILHTCCGILILWHFLEDLWHIFGFWKCEVGNGSPLKGKDCVQTFYFFTAGKWHSVKMGWFQSQS